MMIVMILTSGRYIKDPSLAAIVMRHSAASCIRPAGDLARQKHSRDGRRQINPHALQTWAGSADPNVRSGFMLMPESGLQNNVNLD
jgi:hypothetical protein